MGRNSGGVGARGGLQPGDATYKGSIKNVESLIKIKDPQVYKAVGEAISRYHSVLGVRQRKVKLADLAHNSDQSRFAGVRVSEDRLGYFRDKYAKARAILLEE